MRFKRLGAGAVALALSFVTIFSSGSLTSFANSGFYGEHDESRLYEKELLKASASEALAKADDEALKEENEDFIVQGNENEWLSEDFTFGTVQKKIMKSNEYFAIIGLSNKGKVKIKKNKNLVIPSKVSFEEGGAVIEREVQGVGDNAIMMTVQ